MSRATIAFNPSAGDVHRREAGAPWRADTEEQIAQANAKAREEQNEKRRWGLAKQVNEGLMHNYSINYGVPEMAALLKEAIAIKARLSGSKDVTPSEALHLQLLAAAEKYDLKQLVVLVDKFPKTRSAATKG